MVGHGDPANNAIATMAALLVHLTPFGIRLLQGPGVAA